MGKKLIAGVMAHDIGGDYDNGDYVHECDDDDDNDQNADGLEDARVKMVPKPCTKLTIPPLSGHQCV